MTVLGAKNELINGNYTKTSNFHGKPAYFYSYKNQFGIWFNGDVDYPAWVISSKNNFDEGTQRWITYMKSVGDTNCPEDPGEWWEYFNLQWQINQEASVRPH